MSAPTIRVHREVNRIFGAEKTFYAVMWKMSFGDGKEIKKNLSHNVHNFFPSSLLVVAFILIRAMEYQQCNAMQKPMSNKFLNWSKHKPVNMNTCTLHSNENHKGV